MSNIFPSTKFALNRSEAHFIPATNTFVTVILPMAVPKPYTYYVPEAWIAAVQFGVRVEVQFGKSRLYTALVIDVHHNAPENANKLKPIIAVVDDQPLIHPAQLQLWQWLADYYCCTLGEVMNAALPTNLKLSSETVVALSPVFDGDVTELSEKEHMVVQSLLAQNELSIEDLQRILEQKTVYPLIKSLLERKIIYLQEDLKTKYAPRTVGCVRLREPYASQPNCIREAFALLSRSNRQEEALMAYLQLAKKQDFVLKQDIYSLAKVDATVLNTLAKKGIFELYEREVSRLGGYEEATIVTEALSPQQEATIAQLRAHLATKNVALLHGVTGSGKTRVYVELMQETVARGEQVLYLLPEIALTTQIISRLQKIFGDKIAVYHSRQSNNERVEIWKQVLAGKPIVLGARSALFMPFSNLKLVIVDEEHDPSYKQQDPNPRYNGRDAAIYLANTFGAKVILGTATPSVESYYNAQTGKYTLVTMPERFGGLEMPATIIADVKQELKERKLQAHFTTTLLEALKDAIARGEQAILFQNRRGFAPAYRCATCEWQAECIHCDVNLTYHKHFNALKCHYCGYQTQLPKVCPDCGSKELILQGFGTEKIEDELKIYLPEARIARIDLDTVRTKDAHSRIINDFEERRIDVLVGTQMVTKGLDFENVGIVGVLSADQLLQFPDFRAGERAFQLMLQVSGRSGRRYRRGKVIIQAMNTASPVLAEVLANDYDGFFRREIQERQQFQYPPFTRLIRVTLKHKKPEILNDGAKIFAQNLKARLGEWVIGPAVPYVGRVRGYFLLDLLLKLPRDSRKIRYAKDTLLEAIYALHTAEGYTTIRVNVDVDPY